ncbi:MAG: sulfite exporter TauE/SafE family protein [Clostridiales bacterium]|nr:sulfite exporter TauE/SafE family protein [Clostridiales bacterium]
MQFIWYIVAGIIGGLLGGMGMGGGTLLIPLITIFYSVSQHTAQAINLIGFIPMAIVALIIHIKNRLVKYENVIIIIISGAITCVIGCFLAKTMSGNLLKRCFGAFLLLLSVFQFIDGVKYNKS